MEIFDVPKIEMLYDVEIKSNDNIINFKIFNIEIEFKEKNYINLVFNNISSYKPKKRYKKEEWELIKYFEENLETIYDFFNKNKEEVIKIKLNPIVYEKECDCINIISAKFISSGNNRIKILCLPVKTNEITRVIFIGKEE